jgi:adenylate cyclase
MISSLKRMNDERRIEAEESGKPFTEIRVGIGINTGDCVVGNMGSDMRFDYSVLGDAVNLASRLEGQSEMFGVTIILGSKTAELVSDSFAVLEIDALRVKGKSEPEIVYTLLGTEDEAEDPSFKEMQKHMQELLTSYRSRKWVAAGKALKELRQLNTTRFTVDLSTLIKLYENRIREFRKNPPPKNWDGVYTALTK